MALFRCQSGNGGGSGWNPIDIDGTNAVFRQGDIASGASSTTNVSTPSRPKKIIWVMLDKGNIANAQIYLIDIENNTAKQGYYWSGSYYADGLRDYSPILSYITNVTSNGFTAGNLLGDRAIANFWIVYC